MNQATIDRICKDNKGLVITISRKFLKQFPRTYSTSDVNQVAWEGMLLGIRNFREDGGAPLGPWLSMCISTRIITELKHIYCQMRTPKQDVVSMDKEYIMDKNVVTMHDMLPDDRESSIEELISLRVRYDTALSCLDERELYVVKAYYERNQMLKEIGKAMGVSRQRVDQIHQKAKSKLLDYAWKLN